MNTDKLYELGRHAFHVMVHREYVSSFTWMIVALIMCIALLSGSMFCKAMSEKEVEVEKKKLFNEFSYIIAISAILPFLVSVDNLIDCITPAASVIEKITMQIGGK